MGFNPYHYDRGLVRAMRTEMPWDVARRPVRPRRRLFRR